MAARTQRLYQSDSFQTHFSAKVLDLRSDRADHPDSSTRLAVFLDRTVFYPTGGGQPNDTGLLAGLPVVDVCESEEGPFHVVELRDAGGRPRGAHLTIGAEVEGAVDWGRRFDHMQQHSGQHILSRAFVDVAKARTRSFHLGESICTIDIEMPNRDAVAIHAAEARGNEIVWDDRSVTVREVPAADSSAGAPIDLAMSGLNLKPGDPIRFIEIGGFDSNACGGTHVARTGQVGMVAVIGWEPYKGMTRVTFACGGRALRHLHESREAVAACVKRLSARPHEVPAAVDRLLSEREALVRRIRALGSEIARFEAEKIAGSAPSLGPYRLLRRTFAAAERGVEEAQALVRSFVEAPGCAALVAVVEGGTATILAGRSAGEGVRMGDMMAEVCRAVGGRGGGSATFARAGGIPASRAEEALDAAAALLTASAASGRS